MSRRRGAASVVAIRADGPGRPPGQASTGADQGVPRRGSRPTLRAMSVAEDPRNVSHLTVLAPLDAVDRAQRLPDDDDMVIDGLTDAEWAAFEHALSDR